MSRPNWIEYGILTSVVCLALTGSLAAQEPARQAAYVQLYVPANARVEIDGASTRSTGEERGGGPGSDFFYRGQLVLPRPQDN